VNLVSNAVKFTPEGGRVTISAAEVSSSAEANPADAEEGVGQGGRWLRLDVTDTGIGVPPEERQRIFAPFYQVDSAYNRRNEGTGLGLSISRQLARRMGGDLTLRSTDGRGSRFSLWLPVAGPEEPEERVEWRPGVHDDLQLAAVGQALIRSAAAIVSHLEERLRHDAGIENARDLVTAQLADHIVTFLAAMGVALVTLDEANGDPELMRDGAEIQRTIARLHGAQRGRLGWTEEDIHREFDLLREITRETLARRLDDEADAALDEAIGVVGRLLDQAEQQSIRGRSRALQERS
jgi:hypothetical protein